MVLFSRVSLQSVALVLLISITRGQTSLSLSESEFSERAARLAAQLVPSATQGLNFGQVSISFLPGQYDAVDEKRIYLGMVMPQMWVSDNLAIKGGVGFGSGGAHIVQMLRLSLVYLPSTLAVKGWQPEVVIAQNRIEGLPEMSTVKWNEARWSYKTELAEWQISTGITLLYQRLFTRGTFSIEGIPLRIERSIRRVNFSLGRRLFGRAAVTGQLVVSGSSIVAGIEMSAAL